MSFRLRQILTVRIAVAALTAAALVCVLPARGGAPGGEIAVLVHAKTSVDNLSMAELRKIAMGDRQFWSAGQRITVLMRAPVARERTVVLKKVYQMSESQFKQYWVAKVFRNEAPSGPKVVNSNQTALELIENLPGSIAFVDASQVPKGVKILKVDGFLPSDKGYPLQ
jgi:ABC-type phosphate transport system substrate-binding protein